MIILIDGYNLLKKIHGINVSEMQIRAFVNLLGSYLKKRNHKIKVILDGGHSSFLIKEKQKGVDLWYSGYNRSADDVIVDYVFDHKNKDIVVVTQDREICQKMIEYKIETIDPLVFYERIKEVFKTTDKQKKYDNHDKIIKLIDEENDLIDALMQEAAYMKAPLKDVIELNNQRKSTGQNLSKKEKSRQKALDKL